MTGLDASGEGRKERWPLARGRAAAAKELARMGHGGKGVKQVRVTASGKIDYGLVPS